MLLNVCGLVADGYLQLLASSLAESWSAYLGQTRQIDERQTQHVRRVDFEVDGLPIDSLVVSCYPRGLVLDFTPDLGEIVVSPPWDMEELSPFLLPSNTRWSVRHVDLVIVVGIFAFAGEVDELEDERSSGDDAATSG